MDSYQIIPGSNEGQSEIKVYKRRWYVLTMYSLYAFIQSVVWNTWGPISTVSTDAFGWGDSTIALLNNWGPIAYVLTGLIFPWLLQVKGMRWATLSSMFFVAAGTAFRVITSDPMTATILIHIGQFLNGIGGPIATGSIPALSATWFPPNERVTATALSNSINNMGNALSFILGPMLVPDSNSSQSSNSSPHSFVYLIGGPFFKDELSRLADMDNETAARQSKERKEIMMYMYYACGFAVLLFLIMLCYFPAKPARPPCISATMERDQYWEGLWALRSNGYFLIIMLAYSVSTGVLVVWGSVINMNLKAVGVDEETSGWIGFYSTLIGCVVSLLVGRFADWFVHYMKMFILVMYILATVALVIFALMLINIIPSSIVWYYVTIIAATALLNAAIPLIFELACELAFPTSEAASNGLLTFFNNFWGLIFLGVLSIPNIGTMWMNWTIIGSTAVCIPLIATIKGRFNRLEVDEGVQPQDYTDQEVVVSESAPPPIQNGHVKVDIPDELDVRVPLLSDDSVPRTYGIQGGVQTDSESYETDSLSGDYRTQQPWLPQK